MLHCVMRGPRDGKDVLEQAGVLSKMTALHEEELCCLGWKTHLVSMLGALEVELLGRL